jgi:hypothetical protein
VIIGREEVEQTRRSSHCHSSSILVSGKSASPPPPADHRRTCLDSPNKLSEDLVRLTVTVFHKLRKTAAEPPKLNISCIGGSRSLVPKAAAMSPLKSRSGSSRAAKEEATTNNNGGCRRRFVEFTRGSVDVGRVSLCLVDIKNLRSSEIDCFFGGGCICLSLIEFVSLLMTRRQRVDAEAQRGGPELPDEQAEAGVLDQRLQLLRDACTHCIRFSPVGFFLFVRIREAEETASSLSFLFPSS